MPTKRARKNEPKTETKTEATTEATTKTEPTEPNWKFLADALALALMNNKVCWLKGKVLMADITPVVRMYYPKDNVPLCDIRILMDKYHFAVFYYAGRIFQDVDANAYLVLPPRFDPYTSSRDQIKYETFLDDSVFDAWAAFKKDFKGDKKQLIEAFGPTIRQAVERNYSKFLNEYSGQPIRFEHHPGSKWEGTFPFAELIQDTIIELWPRLYYPKGYVDSGDAAYRPTVDGGVTHEFLRRW